MSGENIAYLIQEHATAEKSNTSSQRENQKVSDTYKRHYKEPPKPPYSTFWEKGKEYDGTHARFFKQRDAVIGRNVGDTIDPKAFLQKGRGIKHIIPPIHEDKLILKPPLEQGRKILDSDKEGDSDWKNERIGENGKESGRCDCCGCEGCNDCSHIDLSNTKKGNRNDSGKDFLSLNVIEAANMVPKGRKLQPEYPTDRKDFGKVPKYLSRIKIEVNKEKECLSTLEGNDSTRQKQHGSYVYKLSDEERTSLLAKLKKKLDENSATLNKMPLSKDSLSNSKKKGELQNIIRDIEKAISKIDRETIFVYKDIPPYDEWAKNAALKEARAYAAEQQKTSC